MPHIGFVTCAALPDLTPDDQLAVAELAAAGLAAHPAVWDDPAVDWRGFDTLVLRSTWDYHLRPEAFQDWLGGIEAAGVRLFNPPGLIRWNLHKRYLADLAARGLPVAPTLWLARGEKVELAESMARNGWARAVVKPAISASAHNTWALTLEEAAGGQPRLDALLAAGDALLQPFMEEVEGEGEWSLIFFARRYSHAVLKRPAAGDFRVQNEHGGGFSAAQPAPETIEQAAAVLAAVDGPQVYARVDGVVRVGVFILMELELIEPYLFLGAEAAAPARFAAAILAALPLSNDLPNS